MASLPDWALIDRYVFRRDDDSFPADEPTEAFGTNSRGDEFRVCFQVHEPPRSTRLYLSWPGGTGEFDRFAVVAAHRDAVLFQMAHPVPVPRREYPYDMYDYFLYRAGTGTPWLHRLPSVYGTVDELRALFEAGKFEYTHQIVRRMEGLDVAVLRRGEEDVAVAELQIIRSGELELHVIFPSKSESTSSQWKVKKPQVIHDPELDLEDLLWDWSADAVIPFGEYLCWVDFYQCAALLCKVFDDTDSPELRYLALPAKLPDNYDRSSATMYMTLSADEKRGVLKFVLITDGHGMMFGSRYKADFGFKAVIWTLQMRGRDEMVWEMGDVVKSEHIWVLESFSRLPRGPLQYPHVSLSNPNIVYFVVKERVLMEIEDDYDNAWLVAIDMPKKTVESSFQYIKWEEGLSPEEHMFVKTKSLYIETFIQTEFPMFLKLNETSFQRSSL